ncbi:hypothetical protein ACJJTC_002391 [Scirpophaga incertulas]
MGIKGTVRRSVDGDFIHANVDIDLIISEDPEFGSSEKPIEIFHIMEHFCLGRRRIHLFGRDSTIRPGWVTLGHELTNSNFKAELYWAHFRDGRDTTGCTERIEALRPKSPPHPASKGPRQRARPRPPHPHHLHPTPPPARAAPHPHPHPAPPALPRTTQAATSALAHPPIGTSCARPPQTIAHPHPHHQPFRGRSKPRPPL